MHGKSQWTGVLLFQIETRFVTNPLLCSRHPSVSVIVMILRVFSNLNNSMKLIHHRIFSRHTKLIHLYCITEWVHVPWEHKWLFRHNWKRPTLSYSYTFTLFPSPPTRPITLTSSHSDRPLRTSFWGQELHKMQGERFILCIRGNFQCFNVCEGRAVSSLFSAQGNVNSSHPVDATSSLEVFLNAFLSLFWANCCIWHKIMKHLMACMRQITLKPILESRH